MNYFRKKAIVYRLIQNIPYHYYTSLLLFKICPENFQKIHRKHPWVILFLEKLLYFSTIQKSDSVAHFFSGIHQKYAQPTLLVISTYQ